MYIPEAAMSYFSVFVSSVGLLVHGLLLVENLSSRRDPKGQNRMPKSGVCKEADKSLTFSQHSYTIHNAQSSVLFYALQYASN